MLLFTALGKVLQAGEERSFLSTQYYAQIWVHQYKRDKDMTETVQKKSMKETKGLKYLYCEDGLGLFSLEKRIYKVNFFSLCVSPFGDTHQEDRARPFLVGPSAKTKEQTQTGTGVSLWTPGKHFRTGWATEHWHRLLRGFAASSLEIFRRCMDMSMDNLLWVALLEQDLGQSNTEILVSFSISVQFCISVSVFPLQKHFTCSLPILFSLTVKYT